MSDGQVDADRLVTQSELAEIRGVSRQYISKLAGIGRLDFIDGKIRLGDALKLLVDGTPGEDDSLNFNEARTETEIWKGKKARLDYEREAGALVRADRVNSHVFNVFFELREKILEALPVLSGKIMRAGSPREAQAIAQDGLTDILAAFADELEKRWTSKAG